MNKENVPFASPFTVERTVHYTATLNFKILLVKIVEVFETFRMLPTEILTNLNVNPLRTKLYQSDLKVQSVPRSKHSLLRS